MKQATRFVPALLALAPFPTLAAPPAAPQGGGGQPPQQPAENFIVIVLDDVGTDKLSFYDGNVAPPYAATPRLYQLANQGIRFTNFYVNPYCSTTRACLQTGRYAYHTGIGGITLSTENAGGLNSFRVNDSEVFLPELLDTAPLAYACGAFGKWHMTVDYVDPDDYLGANGDEEHATRNGYDRFRGMMANVAMLGNGDDHYTWRKVSQDLGELDATISQESRWSASVVREDAVEWINQQTGRYFAYVAFNPPHAPLQVPPYELLSQTTRDELDALSPGPPDDDIIELGDPRHMDPGPHGALYYRAMLESVDKEIANLLDQVKQADLAKYQRTLIVVLSDNGTPHGVIQGPHDPDHGKGTVYQIGVRVPLIVSGTPVPLASRGDECDRLVGAVDLWPTLEQVTGATSSTVIDGVSFWPLVLNTSAASARPYAFSQQFAPNWYPLTTYGCFVGHDRSITDGQYKLVRRQIEKTGSICATPAFHAGELYLLPDEHTNLYGSEPAKVAQLNAAMDALIP